MGLKVFVNQTPWFFFEHIKQVLLLEAALDIRKFFLSSIVGLLFYYLNRFTS